MESLDALKVRLRGAVFQSHLSATKQAELLLQEIDRTEELFLSRPDSWVTREAFKYAIEGEKGWFKAIRRFYRACGRDREKQIRFFFEEVRRSFDRYYWYLVSGGSRAGFDIEDVRHLSTLLLQLDLALPALQDEMGAFDAENAFHLLASAQAAGIDELGGGMPGKPHKKLSFHEKRRLAKRRRVTALAHLLRTFARGIERDMAKRAEAKRACAPNSTCAPSPVVPLARQRKSKVAANRLTPDELETRRQLWLKIRTYYRDKRRNNSKFPLRGAYEHFKVTNVVYRQLKTTADREGWPDPGLESPIAAPA